MIVPRSDWTICAIFPLIGSCALTSMVNVAFGATPPPERVASLY